MTRTFEQLRFECQCPEKLARRLFDDCAALRAELAIAHAATGLERALRLKAESKLNPPAPRRANRYREED